MAKRVAGQRQGLMYALIAVIFVAVAALVFLLLTINSKNTFLRLVDPGVQDPEQIQTTMKDIQKNLDKAGVSTRAGFNKAIEELVRKHDEGMQRISDLGAAIDSTTHEPVSTQNVGNFSALQVGAAMKAVAKANEALKIAPQANVGGAQVPEAAATPKALIPAIALLASHIEAFDAEYKRKLEVLKNLEADNQRFQKEKGDAEAAAKTAFDAMVKEKEVAIAALNQKITETKAQMDEFEKLREAARETLNKAIADNRKVLTEKDAKIRELDATITELSSQIQRVKGRLIDPDGKVVRLPAGQEIGYIDLGKADGVFNNLTFAVYATNEIGKENPAAKGQISIINVMDSSSEVTVTSFSRTNPVVEGDIIANASYDRSRRFHFAVVGKFDLNKDGIDDAEVLKGLIIQHGGKVDEKLTPTTDYLVAGQEPLAGMPAVAKTPQQQGAIAATTTAQNDYSTAMGLAERLHIPVLNQNRLMSLLGVGSAE